MEYFFYFYFKNIQARVSRINAPVTLTVMTRTVIYHTRIVINCDITLVVHGRAAIQAFANLGEIQQYLSHRHRPRRAREIMKLSANPAAIQSYHTQPRWIRDEPYCHRTVILRWSYITAMSLGES